MSQQPTVYGYARVSNDGQRESGLGMGAQTDRVADQAAELSERHGLAIGPIYRDEAVSATRHPLVRRPAGRELDAVLGRGDHVVIAKLDRAFRSQKDCAVTVDRWMRRGVTIHLLDIGVDTSTPQGQMLLGIMSVLAQWEAARIGERIRDAKAVMRRQGWATNGVPRIGWRVERVTCTLHGKRVKRAKLVPDPQERRLCRRIQRLRNKGLLWREIAEQLNREGLRRRGRRPWSPQACWRASRAAKAGFP